MGVRKAGKEVEVSLEGGEDFCWGVVSLVAFGHVVEEAVLQGLDFALGRQISKRSEFFLSWGSVGCAMQ